MKIIAKAGQKKFYKIRLTFPGGMTGCLNHCHALSTAETREITTLTGCMKPCKYKKYIMVCRREKTDILQVWKLHLFSLGCVEKHWGQNRGVDLSSLFIGSWIWRHPGPFLGILLHDPMGQNPPPRIWHNGCRDVQSHLFWNNIFVKSFNLIASHCTGLYQTNAF